MKKKNIMIIVFLIFAVIISLYFDSEIVKGIEIIRNEIFDDFFLGLTNITSEIIIFFFLTSLFLWHDNKRKWILPLWFTLLLSVVISFILKVSVQRLRPFQTGIVSILPILEKSSHLIWNFSFPSFQTMLTFCAIPVLSKEFPRFRYVWIILASLVAFSRIYFGLHFLSDIIAGGLVGYLLGVIVIKTEKRNKFWEKIYRKVFRR